MTTANVKVDTSCGFIRAHHLHTVFPILGKSRWKEVVARGELPARRIGRAVILKVADVEAYLSSNVTGVVR